MALLMMFGCSKDEGITTEQEPFSVEKNNQPVVNGEKGSAKGNAGIVKYLQFFSTSNESGGYFDLGGNPYNTNKNMKLLKQGTFSGSIGGFGNIKSSSSRYEFSSPEETISQKNDTIWCDYTSYKLTANGKISLDASDYCFINISGYACFVDNNYGGFSGIAKTHSGVGKLKNFNKIFKVYHFGLSSPGFNLTTGEIRLQFVEYVKY